MAALEQVHVMAGRTRSTRLAPTDETLHDDLDSLQITAINSYSVADILVTSVIIDGGANLSAFNSLERFETYQPYERALKVSAGSVITIIEGEGIVKVAVLNKD
jgi:hypothetical protein